MPDLDNTAHVYVPCYVGQFDRVDQYVVLANPDLTVSQTTQGDGQTENYGLRCRSQNRLKPVHRPPLKNKPLLYHVPLVTNLHGKQPIAYQRASVNALQAQ